MSGFRAPRDEYEVNIIPSDESHCFNFIGHLDMKEKAGNPVMTLDEILALRAECKYLQESLRQSENARCAIENANSSTAAAALLAQKNLDAAEKRRSSLSEQVKMLKDRLAISEARISSLLASDDEKKRKIDTQESELLLLKQRLQDANRNLDMMAADLASSKNRYEQLAQTLQQVQAANDGAKSSQMLSNSADTYVASLLAVSDEMKRTLDRQTSEAKSLQQQLQITQAQLRQALAELELEKGQREGSSPGRGKPHNNDLLGRNDAARSAHEQNLRRMIEQKTDETEMLRKQFSDLRQHLQSIESEHDAAVSRLNAEKLVNQRLRHSLQQSESARFTMEYAVLMSQNTPHKTAEAIQGRMTWLLEQLRETSELRDAAESHVSSLIELQQDMQRTIDQQASQAMLHADQIDLISSQADFLSSYINDIAMVKTNLEFKLEEVQKGNEMLKLQLQEERENIVLQRTVSFLKLWRNFSIFRSWRQWKSCSDRHKRRRLLFLRCCRKLTGGVVIRCFVLWADFREDLRQEAQMEDFVRQVSQLKLSLQEKEQHLKLEVASANQKHASALELLEKEKLSRTVTRAIAFIRYWKKSDMAKAWNRWNGWYHHLTVRKQRHRPLVQVRLKHLTKNLIARSWWCWISYVQDLDAMEYREAEVEFEARVTTLLRQAFHVESMIAQISSSQQDLKAKLLFSEQQQQIHRMGRARAFVRFWRKSDTLSAWKRWTEQTFERIAVRRRRRHVLHHKNSKGTQRRLGICWEEWLVTMYESRNQNTNEKSAQFKSIKQAQVDDLLIIQKELEHTIEVQASEASVLAKHIEVLSGQMKQSSYGVWVLKDDIDARLAASEEVHKSLREENKKLLSDIGNARFEHDQLMQTMVERLNRCFDDNLRLSQQIEQSKESIQFEHQYRHNLEKECGALKNENATIKKDMDDIRQDHEKHLQSVLSITNELWEEKNSLQQRLVSYEKKTEVLQADLKAEQGKTSQLHDRLDVCRMMADESRTSAQFDGGRMSLVQAQNVQASENLHGSKFLRREASQEKFQKEMLRTRELRSEPHEIEVDSLLETIRSKDALISSLRMLEHGLKRRVEEESSKCAQLEIEFHSLEREFERLSIQKKEAESHVAALLIEFEDMAHKVYDTALLKGMPVSGYVDKDNSQSKHNSEKSFAIGQLKTSQAALADLAVRLAAPPNCRPDSMMLRLAVQSLSNELDTWNSEMDVLRLESKLERIPDMSYEFRGQVAT